MSLDLVIKQKFFGTKTMPLDVILGETLQCGALENDLLKVGEPGDGEIIVFNPNGIGRGFSVTWTPKERKALILRLLTPSTMQELTDFYATVERMATYWNATLTLDGEKISLEAFMATFRDYAEFNDKSLNHLARQVLAKEQEGAIVLYSAMFPLSVGKEECELFLDNPTAFAQWLHEKQALDAYYASPRFFEGEDGIFGGFFLTNNLRTVYPTVPTVPFGAVNYATGSPLECNRWLITLRIDGEEENLCQAEYAAFLEALPKEKKSRFDATHFLLSELTEEELRTLANNLA